MFEREPVKVMQVGKTARDKESGARGRSLANRAKRVAWDHAMIAAGSQRGRGTPFPLDACNGRESRAIRAASGRVRKPKGQPKRGKQ